MNKKENENEKNELNEENKALENIKDVDDIELISENEEHFSKFKKIKEKLKECQKEKNEYLENWQKERANFQNYKKEELKRFEIFKQEIKNEIILDFLEVIDSFEIAFANKDQWNKIDENWRKGIEFIYFQILKILEKRNIFPLETKEGDYFNPEFHQSIETVKTDKKELDNVVKEIVKKGFKDQEKIIRPAQVKVFKFFEE